MTGYRLQLPDGWSRTRLTGDLDHEAKRIVERALPRAEFGDSDAVVARHRLRAELRDALGAAADAGGVDLYAFDGEVEGVRLPMSFSLAVTHLGASLGALPLDVLGRGLAGSGRSTVVDLPAGQMIRISEERRRSAGTSPQAASRSEGLETVSAASREAIHRIYRFIEDNSDVVVTDTTVDYLVPVLGEHGSFVLVSFVAPGARDVAARVGHFDVLMAGFGWTR